MRTVEDRVRQFFREQSEALKRDLRKAIAKHQGLRGAMREVLIQRFLRDLLPGRYGLDRGQVFSPNRISQEADIAIWDQMDYGSIPQGDAKILYSESVRVVVEVKSKWNSKEWADTKKKAHNVHELPWPDDNSVMGRILAEREWNREQWNPRGHHSHEPETPKKAIGFVSVFATGGKSFTPESVKATECEHAGYRWPEIMYLMEPGRLYMRNGRPRGWGDWFDVVEPGDDALLIFSSLMLHLVEWHPDPSNSNIGLSRFCPELKKSLAGKRLILIPDQAGKPANVQCSPIVPEVIRW